jgi:hypothetical protein
MSLSQSEMYSLARKAGLPDASAKVAAAIGMAESGGNPNDHNTDASTGDNSYGLWQINMLGSMGPTRRTQFGLKTNDDLFDPATNARAMSILSHQGQNFNAWTTYKGSKKYMQFMGNPVSTVSVANVSLIPSLPDAIGGTINSSLQAMQALVKGVSALEHTATWVSNPQNWIRVAYVIGGSVIAVAGLGYVIKSTTAGSAAIEGGKKIGKTAAKAAVVL